MKAFLFAFLTSCAAFDILPPVRYKEIMNTILLWIQQSETKLSIPQVTVTDLETMEKRLKELKVNREILSCISTLSFNVKAVSYL